MKEIPLSQGFVAWVDDEDYEEIAKFKWYARRSKANYYASRSVKDPGPDVINMHDAILGARPGWNIDHRRHRASEKVIDNRRENLRFASVSENAWNSRKRPLYGGAESTSIFKGVTRRFRRWGARIRLNGKNVSLGSFRSEAHAAYAYDIAAVEHFGEFALTNFPVPGSTQWIFGPEVMHG